MLPVDIGSSPTFTIASLENPSHPGCRYLGIEIFGTANEGTRRIILPKPAIEDDSYEIVVNVPPGLLQGDNIEIADDPVLGTVATIIAPSNTAQEITWDAATDSIATAAAGQSPEFVNVRATRIRVLVRPNGCSADNGYTGNAVGG